MESSLIFPLLPKKLLYGHFTIAIVFRQIVSVVPTYIWSFTGELDRRLFDFR